MSAEQPGSSLRAAPARCPRGARGRTAAAGGSRRRAWRRPRGPRRRRPPAGCPRGGLVGSRRRAPRSRRRSPAAAPRGLGDTGGRALIRGGRLAHPHRGDHRQVVAERDHRADHDHDPQPCVAAGDGRVDQVELPHEARGGGDPGEAEHRERHRPREPRLLAAEARHRAGAVAEVGGALAGDDHRERGHVHEQVDGEVEDGGAHAQLGGDDDAGEHVAGLCDGGVGEHPLQRGLPERADVADDDRDRRERRDGRAPTAMGFDQRDVEEAQEDAERGGLCGDRHERRDRRRRALVDVGRPLVEGGDRGLEGEAGDRQRDAGQQQHVGGEAVAGDRRGDRAEVGGAGGAVDQRDPVQQRRRADGADDQVLQPRLQRVLAFHFGRAQHVQRDRQQLQADEQRNGVLRRRQQRHPRDRGQQQRVKLAVAGFFGGERAPRQQHGRGAAGDQDQVEHQREVVDPQRPGEDRLPFIPLPDRQARRRPECDERQSGDQLPAHAPGAQQADE